MKGVDGFQIVYVRRRNLEGGKKRRLRSNDALGREDGTHTRHLRRGRQLPAMMGEPEDLKKGQAGQGGGS